MSFQASGYPVQELSRNANKSINQRKPTATGVRHAQHFLTYDRVSAASNRAIQYTNYDLQ